MNWCPKDATVLANEQVIDGRCERCGTLVEQRDLEQWFFRITDYADRLLDDLEHDRLAAQRRGDAAELDRPLGGRRGGLPLRGARHRLPGLHHAPRHPVRRHLLRHGSRAPRRAAAERLARGAASTCAARSPSRPRSAAPRTARRPAWRSARTVTNPVNGEQIPMFVADYVLMEYGTGAIMAVPAHDERDFEFAQRHGLEIRRVIEGGDELPYSGDGPMVDQRPLRRPAQPRGLRPDRRVAGREGKGRAGGELPPARLAALAPALLGLPDPDRALRELRARRRCPTTSCRSSCPRSRTTRRRAARRSPRPRTGCARPARSAAAPARRETDTMDTFVDSSWYFLRYCDARNDERALGPRGARRAGCRSTSTSAAWSTRSCT